jgi:hypothetical protein
MLNVLLKTIAIATSHMTDVVLNVVFQSHTFLDKFPKFRPSRHISRLSTGKHHGFETPMTITYHLELPAFVYNLFGIAGPNL